MKNTVSPLVMFFALIVGGAHMFGQTSVGPGPKKARTLEDYEPRTLKELNAEKCEADLGDKQERLVVHGDILPSRVTLNYTSSTRPLPEMKKEVIRQWARLYAGSLDHYTKPYETEILFEEAGVGHWIAVRQQSLPLLREKLKQGDAVNLYLIRLGRAREGDEWESVFLVEDFLKHADPLVNTEISSANREPLSPDESAALNVELLKTRLLSTTAQNLTVHIREGCRLQITERMQNLWTNVYRP